MNNDTPKISVWMTCYNQENYIGEAVQSVLNQTLMPYEILISDDCSTDQSRKILKEFELKFPDLIKVYYQPVRLGITKNKNFILSRVKGEYITWLDGDDRFRPRKLEKEIECLQKFPEAKIVFSDVDCIDSKGEFLYKCYKKELVEKALKKEINCATLLECYPAIFFVDYGFAHQRNELVHKDVINAVGMYDENVILWQDYEYRIRQFKEFNAVYNPFPLQDYRDHSEANRHSSSEDFLKDLVYIYNKYSKDIRGLKLTKSWYLKFRGRLGNIKHSDRPRFPILNCMVFELGIFLIRCRKIILKVVRRN